MTEFDHAALCAELDAIVAAGPIDASACACPSGNELAVASQLSLHTRPRPHIVAGANMPRHQIALENKKFDDDRWSSRQYVDGTPSHTPTNQPIKQDASSPPVHNDASQKLDKPQSLLHENREATAWQIAAIGVNAQSNSLVQTKLRRPKRRTAQLDLIAARKTWSGTKSKGRKDKLNDVEKFVAAIWSTTDAKGVAVTLNLGIRRESMLIEHHDPRRRMTQNLHRHLSAAGFGKVPYAFAFEITPERDGGRLHLHGVMDTSELSNSDLARLGEALRKAASHASGALGGQRQLDMAPLFDAVGWADYLLEDATRTARDLRIDTPFMLNDPMKRLAKSYFERLRMEVKRRADDAKVASPTTRRETKIQPEHRPEGFTVRSNCDRRRLSGERDAKSAGGVFSRARHRPKKLIAPAAPKRSSSQRQFPTNPVEMPSVHSAASTRQSPTTTALTVFRSSV